MMERIIHSCTPKEAMNLIRRDPASQTRIFVYVHIDDVISAIAITRIQLKRLLDEMVDVDNIKVVECKWNLTKVKTAYYIR